MPTRFVPALACISWLTVTAAMAQASPPSSPPSAKSPAMAEALPTPGASPPARPSASPVPPAAADAKTQALDFVRSYAAVSTSQAVARWGADPICIRVLGLTSDQQSSVTKRVEEVAKAVGLKMASANCQAFDIQIVFAADPQGVLDRVVKGDSSILGDTTSGTKGVVTITLPIQAWYLTNGIASAENSTPALATDGDGNLKVRVDWQGAPSDAGLWWGADPGGRQNLQTGRFPPRSTLPQSARSPRLHRQFESALVVVDTRRMAGKSLGVISDYVAMLALSQPRALGQCNALPSVTDLFERCPSRPAPDGLTVADSAYLKALYAKGPGGPRLADESGVAQRMAKILADDAKVASR